jgi:hypothetical protein
MKGDIQQSPWVWTAADYVGKVISITVYFDNVTRTLTNTGPGSKCAIVHRDTGCMYHTIVFDDPNNAASPRLPAPADGAGDVGYTVVQVRNASKNQLGFSGGWQTWEDTQTVQITAEP